VREVIGEISFIFGKVVIENVGFDGGEAADAPTGEGEGFDEFGFDRGGGVELVEVGGAEGVEFGLGFVGEQNLFGVEAVFEGVLRRAGFAGEGRRAAFGFGWHALGIAGGRGDGGRLRRDGVARAGVGSGGCGWIGCNMVRWYCGHSSTFVGG
jgi:hypothetical protein